MIEIYSARPDDAYALAGRMRAADWDEYAALGVHPAITIRADIEASIWANVALIDGVPAAAWGIVTPGGTLATRARVWAMTTYLVERHKLRFMRESRAFVEMASAIYPEIEALCDKRYAVSVAWLERLGFKSEQIVRIGSERVPFRRMVRRVA